MTGDPEQGGIQLFLYMMAGISLDVVSVLSNFFPLFIASVNALSNITQLFVCNTLRLVSEGS